MSSASGNTASNASGKPGRRDRFLSLTTSRRMVPLVERIVAEVSQTRRALERILPELERLDRQRRTLDWAARSRRYALHEEVSAARGRLEDGLAELEVLGVRLFDALTGQVGFPTQVNGRRAYFSWKPGEADLRCWHFAGESVRRSIPASWREELQAAAAAK